MKKGGKTTVGFKELRDQQPTQTIPEDETSLKKNKYTRKYLRANKKKNLKTGV